MMHCFVFCFCFFFFNDTATTEIYTLSLHDALPFCIAASEREAARAAIDGNHRAGHVARERDRKSTRLNSCHTVISYAVFCLKKKISQSTFSVKKKKIKSQSKRKTKKRKS